MDNLQLKCGFDDDKNKTKLAHLTLGPGCHCLCHCLALALPSPVACLASLHMSLCYWWPQMLMSQSSLALCSYCTTIYLSLSLCISFPVYLCLSLFHSRQVSHWRPSLKQANLLHTSCQQPEPLCVSVCAACLWHVCVYVCMCVLHSITCNFWPAIVCQCRHRSKTAASLDKRVALLGKRDRERERVLRNIFHIFHDISSDSHLSHFNSSFIYAKGKLSGDTLAPSTTATTTTIRKLSGSRVKLQQLKRGGQAKWDAQHTHT